MIVYCLQHDIIKLENIKYVIKSSLTLKKDYYNKFIDYVYNNIKDYNKLAINSMIGKFKPNKIKNEMWYSNVFTSDSTEAFNSYIENNSGMYYITINGMNVYGGEHMVVLPHISNRNRKKKSRRYKCVGKTRRRTPLK